MALDYSCFLSRMSNANRNIETWFLMNMCCHFSRIGKFVSCGSVLSLCRNYQSFYHGSCMVSIGHSLYHQPASCIYFHFGFVFETETCFVTTAALCAQSSCFCLPSASVTGTHHLAMCGADLPLKVLQFMFLAVVHIGFHMQSSPG